MKGTIIYIAGRSGTLNFARAYLADHGVQITNRPEPDVTHLLLPAPSFEPDGRIKGGGILEHILADLPESITVIGGNLFHPALPHYKKLDLLQDPLYLAENAAITADCAIRVAGTHLKTVFRGCPVLVIGWGRIGKCLSSILKDMDCLVTVAARKASDRCTIRSLGFHSVDIDEIPSILAETRLIFNTVPAAVLQPQQLLHCHSDRVLIDLASQPGLIGRDVIHALALPGKHAPEASGQLMGKTILQYIKEARK